MVVIFCKHMQKKYELWPPYPRTYESFTTPQIQEECNNKGKYVKSCKRNMMFFRKRAWNLDDEVVVYS